MGAGAAETMYRYLLHLAIVFNPTRRDPAKIGRWAVTVPPLVKGAEGNVEPRLGTSATFLHMSLCQSWAA